MESGKLYVLLVDDKNWVVKFDRYNEENIFHKTCVNTETKFYDKDCALCRIKFIHSIRPATNDEVLKYFPDEKFEPIELRPGELVSGEVYTLVSPSGHKYTFVHDVLKMANSRVYYNSMYAHKHELLCESKDKGESYYMDVDINEDRFFHATPEEKGLLLGEEEQTEKQLEDWKGFYAQLLELYTKKEVELENAENKALEWEEKANTSKTWENTAKNWENAYDQMTEKANDWKANFEKLQDKYSKLEAYNDELTEKINQTENQNNQEKVYFYHDGLTWDSNSSLDDVLINSREDYDIYEAVKIGVKKSVLVNEN